MIKTMNAKNATYINDHQTFLTYLSHDINQTTRLLSYAATKADLDTMNLKQALGEPDANKFLEAMEKEVQDHV